MRSEKLIVALDLADESDAKALVRKLKKDVSLFKIGLQLYTKAGPTIIKAIQKTDHKVFLDLKFHDIPTTVAKAVMEATKLGVFMLTLHALGGKEMMERAVDAAQETSEKLGLQRPLLLAVTIATSRQDVGEIGITGGVAGSVLRLAKLAQEAGCDGVVCSPQEIEEVRRSCGNDFLVVTPGIRLGDDEDDDQKRVDTPQAAFEAGASYIVVGRPILRASDPVLAVKKINASIHGLDPSMVSAPVEEVPEAEVSEAEVPEPAPSEPAQPEPAQAEPAQEEVPVAEEVVTEPSVETPEPEKEVEPTPLVSEAPAEAPPETPAETSEETSEPEPEPEPEPEKEPPLG